jgi:ketosteroid isomerase-like protein
VRSARPPAPAPANGSTDDAALAAKEAFVEHFRAGWAGGADTLVARFLPDLLDPEVVMTQPLLPPARGHDGFAAFFDMLFGAIPDLRGEVHGWCPTGDGVEIDFTLHGTLGGRAPFALPTTDRIVLREGRVLERHARMDPRALARIVARHPLASLWLLTAPLRARLRRIIM